MCQTCDEARAALAHGPELDPAVDAELSEHIDTHCTATGQPTVGQTLPAMTSQALRDRLEPSARES